jgi:hypothetical protein
MRRTGVAIAVVFFIVGLILAGARILPAFFAVAANVVFIFGFFIMLLIVIFAIIRLIKWYFQ